MEQKKTVTFKPTIDIIKILNEDKWYDDYREARKNNWATLMADRERFKRRCRELEAILRFKLP